MHAWPWPPRLLSPSSVRRDVYPRCQLSSWSAAFRQLSTTRSLAWRSIITATVDLHCRTYTLTYLQTQKLIGPCEKESCASCSRTCTVRLPLCLCYACAYRDFKSLVQLDWAVRGRRRLIRVLHRLVLYVFVRSFPGWCAYLILILVLTWSAIEARIDSVRFAF
jgi:hypothetical protein